MIRSSFVFLDGIGSIKEQNIKLQGVETWEDFLRKESIDGISCKRKVYYDRRIERAKKELYSLNSSYFKKILSPSETWRLYNFFKEDAVFLDIETSNHRGGITIIGMFDGIETKTMVKDMNLDKELLKNELSKYKLIVTFNGSSFDLPIIDKYFQGVIPDIPHFDLRSACTRLGLNGGLKKVEQILRIKRPIHLMAYGGDNAIDLWRAFKASGDREYLELLVQYNEEDIVNLKPLAEHVVGELWRKTNPLSQKAIPV